MPQQTLHSVLDEGRRSTNSHLSLLSHSLVPTAPFHGSQRIARLQFRLAHPLPLLAFLSNPSPIPRFLHRGVSHEVQRVFEVAEGQQLREIYLVCFYWAGRALVQLFAGVLGEGGYNFGQLRMRFFCGEISGVVAFDDPPGRDVLGVSHYIMQTNHFSRQRMLRLCLNCDMSMSWDARRPSPGPSSICRASFFSYRIFSSFSFNSRSLSRKISSRFSSSPRFRISSTSTALIFSCQARSPSLRSPSSRRTSSSRFRMISSVIECCCSVCPCPCRLLLAFSLFSASFCSSSLMASCLLTQVSCVFISSRSPTPIFSSSCLLSLRSRVHSATMAFIFSPYSSSLRTTLRALLCLLWTLRCPSFSSSSSRSSQRSPLISSSFSWICSLLYTHSSCRFAMKIRFLRSVSSICCLCTYSRFSRTSSSYSSIRVRPMPQLFFLALSRSRISSNCLANSQICVFSFMFCSISRSFWLWRGSRCDMRYTPDYSYSYYSSYSFFDSPAPFASNPWDCMNSLGVTTPYSASRFTCNRLSTTSTASSSSLLIQITFIQPVTFQLQYKMHDRDRERSSSGSPRHREQERPPPRFKLEQTRTLMLQNAEEVLQQAQAKFTDLSIAIGTSVPDQVQLSTRNLMVRYPSVEAATAVFEHLHGEITIANRTIRVQYYPVRRVDLTLAYDWYCEKCDYKNFGRRNRCYRCESEKTNTCRLSYSTQAAPAPSSRPSREESAQNCSLMVRGAAVAEVEQNQLLAVFEAMVPVRDIRQIRNKLTGKFKDFAFIEFFTPEETAQAYRIANEPDFRINGQRVSVMYSRNKSDDDYFKPLPYEAGKRERKVRQRPQQQDNYYHRQRQRQIEEEKARPSITMEQLKQKRELEIKRHQPVAKELNEEQSRRRQAEQLAKQWQKQMKELPVLYLCPACARKFVSAEQMKLHETHSKLHKHNLQKINAHSLAL